MQRELINNILEWDVQSWKKALYYWEKKVDWKNIHNALELGARQGGLSLWLALKGIETVCSDLTGAEETASHLHKKYGVSSFVKYQDIDATNIPYENFFDVIIFKSIIGGIGRDNNSEQQQKAFEEIYKALKPGGKLLYAENLVASPLHQYLRKNFVKWGSSWRYASIEEMKGFLKIFSSNDFKTSGVLAAFGRNETQRKFLCALDSSLLNNIGPDCWKYIIYGVAEK